MLRVRYPRFLKPWFAADGVPIHAFRVLIPGLDVEASSLRLPLSSRRSVHVDGPPISVARSGFPLSLRYSLWHRVHRSTNNPLQHGSFRESPMTCPVGTSTSTPPSGLTSHLVRAIWQLGRTEGQDLQDPEFMVASRTASTCMQDSVLPRLSASSCTDLEKHLNIDHLHPHDPRAEYRLSRCNTFDCRNLCHCSQDLDPVEVLPLCSTSATLAQQSTSHG